VRVSDFSKMLLCENHIDAVLDCYYMPGVSDKFSTCSEDGTIRLWDANDYSVTARCSVVSTSGVFPNCSIFTDEVIISGWADGKIRSFRIDNC
jgi:cilia- and flagella-associated protein 52